MTTKAPAMMMTMTTTTIATMEDETAFLLSFGDLGRFIIFDDISRSRLIKRFSKPPEEGMGPE